MAQPSIRRFIQELEQVRDKTLQAMMRFQLELGIKIQAQTQDNIKATFGRGRGPRSELTQRAYGSTARRAGRGGGLFQSVNLERTQGGAVTVSVGGPGVPYAAIHEFGGTVLPVTAKFLTIPFQPKYAGARAGEFNLQFGVDPAWGRVLVRAGARQGVDGLYEDSDIAYVLRRSATIPPRPYFQPAVEKVTQNESVRETMRRLIGRSKLNVEVT